MWWLPFTNIVFVCLFSALQWSSRNCFQAGSKCAIRTSECFHPERSHLAVPVAVAAVKSKTCYLICCVNNLIPKILGVYVTMKTINFECLLFPFFKFMRTILNYGWFFMELFVNFRWNGVGSAHSFPGQASSRPPKLPARNTTRPKGMVTPTPPSTPGASQCSSARSTPVPPSSINRLTPRHMVSSLVCIFK